MDEDLDNFERHNLTELVLMARDIDPEVNRGMGRERLLEIISTGESVPGGLPPRRTNKVRLAIMGWVIDHYELVRPLLSCPASSKSPHACFQCTDIQVVECAVTNRSTIFSESTKKEKAE